MPISFPDPDEPRTARSEPPLQFHEFLIHGAKMTFRHKTTVPDHGPGAQQVEDVVNRKILAVARRPVARGFYTPPFTTFFFHIYIICLLLLVIIIV